MRAPLLVALTAILLYGSAPPALTDLDGRRIHPLSEPTSVLVFTRTDCPIANRYAPELTRLHQRFHASGVRFWAVYVAPAETVETIRAHVRAYQLPFPALLDSRHELVKLSRAQTTPEVAVFRHGRLVYRGRIDDRYAALGKARASASTHDLENVLEDVVAGRRPALRTTKAVGCVIEDLR